MPSGRRVGRLVNFFNVLVAVAVVGIPASIIAAGFTDMLGEQRAGGTEGDGGEQRDGAEGAEGDEDELLENLNISCCFGAGYTKTYPTMSAATELQVHRFLEGKTPRGAVFEKFIFTLIILNVLGVVAESINSVYSSAEGFWTAFEYISVLIFSVEYGLRVYSATQNPGSGFSRLVYMTTFYGVVDFLTIAPFFIERIVVGVSGADEGADGSDAEVFRVMRILRLLELEHFIEAFSLLDDVYRESKKTLHATGILALVIWVGGAVLFYLAEHDADADGGDPIPNIPTGLFYTAVFLGGEWAICDFTVPGKVLCVVYCTLGIALYGTAVGFLVDAFSEVLERRLTRSSD